MACFGAPEASGVGSGYSQGLSAPPRLISRPLEKNVFGVPGTRFVVDRFSSGKAKLDPETMKFGFSVKNYVYTLSGKLIARRNDQF